MELQIIKNKIVNIRGQKVILDFDLAEMYDVETKSLKRAVKRNIERFPSYFMFELTKDKYENLRCQNGTSSHGGLRYMPFAFTEQGVAMLSSVLHSPKAIEVNISIMRTFIYIRNLIQTSKELEKKLSELEQKFDKKFKDISEAIHYLLKKDKEFIATKSRTKIGYK